MSKFSPLQMQIRKIHDKHFPIRKRVRLSELMNYFNKTDFHKFHSEDAFEKDMSIRDLSIIGDSDFYKLEDYFYSITDEIFDEIIELKVKINGAIQ